MKTRDERLAWWRDARFGMFIHWGVYSGLGNEFHGRKGGGYAEHIQRVLAECDGNVSEASRRLGLHRRTLQRKLGKRPIPESPVE